MHFPYLQVTVLVHQDVTRLQVSVDHTCRVHVFQTTLKAFSVSDKDRESVRTKAHQYLVQEVLDELLFQRPRGQQPMKIRSQKFRNKVAAKENKSQRLSLRHQKAGHTCLPTER
jgi:hypothetical protein